VARGAAVHVPRLQSEEVGWAGVVRLYPSLLCTGDTTAVGALLELDTVLEPTQGRRGAHLDREHHTPSVWVGEDVVALVPAIVGNTGW
jgi:hypothetical protein